ncbi:transporter substrate-binding domain-containing protein [Cohnella abietis]|uniref:Amino acid ABC transporter substrate-binding protein n=1 Tax=Cohnella abietis TaxID=2507935 RepID=A0A3T1D5S7_9BACL|nr:transporter substrate-binding domain-containing protein [Cohnella abietis]BBI33305.1 amino acid ABC transporter substrate-binding protein [Cohnella abietis]
MRKGFTVAALALGLAVVATGCSSNNNNSASSPSSSASGNENAGAKVVKMAINNTWKPFGFVDDKDELTGYNIDVLKAADEKIPEYKFEFEGVDQSAVFVGVDTGKDALGAGSFFKSPEREEKYLFPDENYGNIVLYLAVKSDNTEINSLDDLVGKKLVPLMPNTSNYNVIKDYNDAHPDKQIKLETIDNVTTADALKWVNSGRYDAFLVPGMTYFDTQKDLKLDLKLTDVIKKNPIYFVLNKSETDLKAKLDAALKDLKADGTLSEISQKWMGEDIFKE